MDEDDLQSYHLEAALELALGTDEVLSNPDVSKTERIRVVLEATNQFLKVMAQEGYIDYEAEQ